MKKALLTGGIIAAIAVGAAVFFSARPRPEENSNVLEIFSWWTAEGESEGLQALYTIYNEQNPGVEIVTATIVGGSGYNARPVLQTLMEGGIPPDAVQVLAGPGLIETWVKPGLLEPLTFLYEENGWKTVFPKTVLDIVSYKNEIYAVPLLIHRSNLLWYNISIFQKYGLEAPETMADFFLLNERLADNGITPIALGDINTWPTHNLLECILISTLGPEEYEGLWNGETAWDSPGMALVLERFLRAFQFTNTDHAALTWDEAVQYVIDGKCATIMIGDFAEAYFKAKGLVPGEDFGWCPFPGTQEVFVLISDAFVLPKKANHRENAVKWLELLGSLEGQDAFNPKKGSIPARIDGDSAKYDVYLQTSMEDVVSSRIVGSFTHGAAAPTEWQNDITEIINNLLYDKNIGKALDSMQTTADRYLE